MQPSSSLPLKLPRKIDNIKFVLSDVDDTITSGGQLLPQTYLAMHQLVQQGIIFIPITGGCAGWCDSFSRLWPAAAVIGENGGFYLKKQPDNSIEYSFWQDQSERAANTKKLLKLAEQALKLVPQVKLAKDQAYRLVDVAIDYNQDISGINPQQIAQILAVFHQAGANAKASSIHVNTWIGDYNKKAMACLMLAKEYQLSEQQMQEQVLFIGDSLNDETMFEFFPNSVGVANIESQLNQLEHRPKWITQQPFGLGFEEMVAALLAK
ncbi:MAG: HAD superfamily hydrolase (TIGR01484 family) [Oceanospirillaceae bacterium]|jgi:HAD superfamily hydrolase (TIGR01484 family)